MLVSYTWLQEHFEKKLPEPEELKDLLTLYAFEVEEMKNVGDDTIIDIDVLPNRASDCLSHQGIVRELATLLEIPFHFPELFSSGEFPGSDDEIEVALESPLCLRYMARKVSNVSITESPSWMKDRLEKLGEKSINAIVDATNIVLFETGQPLHAFDADKISGDTIIIREAKNGEMLTTLDGKELTLVPGTLIIADEKDPLALAGVKGGKKAEVDMNTKDIILESANFDPQHVRLSAQKYGIRTEASKRFENEVSPSLTPQAMNMLSNMIRGLEGGKNAVFGKVSDHYPNELFPDSVAVSSERISRLLGISVSKKEIEEILDRLFFSHTPLKLGQDLPQIVLDQIGKDYVYGTQPNIQRSLPKSFDASSLVFFLFRMQGIRIPTTLPDQFVFGEMVEREELLPGDAIFANSGSEFAHFETLHWMPGTKIVDGVDHVGIYAGEGRVLHSSRKEGEVTLEPIESASEFGNIVGYRRMHTPDDGMLLVTGPLWRTDINIPEDVAEEIGRVYGYEKIDTAPLEDEAFSPVVLPSFLVINKIRNLLTNLGFSEIYTHTFQASGDITLKNPPASDRAFLRRELSRSLLDSLQLNEANAPLLGQTLLKVFEIGTAWNGGHEEVKVAIGVRDTQSKKEKRVSAVFTEVRECWSKEFPDVTLPAPSGGVMEFTLPPLQPGSDQDTYGDTLQNTAREVAYARVSIYPFLLRDIAVFIPEEDDRREIEKIIKEEAGDLLARLDLFDVFQKEIDGANMVSYAYHIVLQSQDHTLRDNEGTAIMERITGRLNNKEGYTVR